MTVILAQRANLDGPNPPSENSIAPVRQALEPGFGIETDLRRDPAGGLYIAQTGCSK